MSEWLLYNGPLIQNFCVLALLGYSVQVAVRAGVLSFATIGFYAVGGYLSANLLKEAEWAWPVVMLAACAVAVALATAMSPILRRLKALYLAMATLAATLFVQALAQSWDTYTGGAQGLFLIPRSLPQLTMIAIVVLVVAAGWFTQRGAWGRAITSIRHDELLSAASGVRVARYQAAAFVFSAMLGAMAGFVQVSAVGVFGPTDIGFAAVISSLTVLVIGGSLAWYGPVLGALLLANLPIYLAGVSEYSLIIQALVLIFVAVYLPRGLAGFLDTTLFSLRRFARDRARTASAPRVTGTPEVHDEKEGRHESAHAR